MADYGARIRTPNGNLVIDGQYQNFALRAKGSSTTSEALFWIGQASGEFWGVRTLQFSGGSTPCIALRSIWPCFIFSQTYANGVWTFQIFIRSDAQGSGLVEWYLFDSPDYATLYNTNYGIVVRNQFTGVKVFDSRCPYMRVVDVIAQNRPQGLGDNEIFVNKTYPVGKVAAIQSQMAYEQFNFQVRPPPVIVWRNLNYITAFAISEATLLVKSMLLQDLEDTSAVGGGWQLMYNLTVIDVSNF